MPRRLGPVAAVAAFGALSCVLSWTYWGVASAASPEWSYYPGLFGPAVAAALVAAASGWGRDLARRTLTWRTHGAAASIVVLGALALALVGTAVSSGGLSKDGVPGSGLLGFSLAMAAAGFGEELGWRGFATPRLLERADAIRASVATALLWAIWHWPLFVLFDGYSDLGVAGVVPWCVSLVCASVVLTWLVVQTDAFSRPSCSTPPSTSQRLPTAHRPQSP
jgi:CAAX protease family protein